ncbi:MAG: hypothetical protein CMJ58_17355 [Planctomycetaceae bacterium]|nr:hypothetical protein [Planctomycetaceae bacterium]
MDHPRRTRDPTPEEIAAACERIRAGWTEAERQRRLRPDWRNGTAMVHAVDHGDLQAAAQAARR